MRLNPFRSAFVRRSFFGRDILLLPWEVGIEPRVFPSVSIELHSACFLESSSFAPSWYIALIAQRVFLVSFFSCGDNAPNLSFFASSLRVRLGQIPNCSFALCMCFEKALLIICPPSIVSGSCLISASTFLSVHTRIILSTGCVQPSMVCFWESGSPQSRQVDALSLFSSSLIPFAALRLS